MIKPNLLMNKNVRTTVGNSALALLEFLSKILRKDGGVPQTIAP